MRVAGSSSPVCCWSWLPSSAAPTESSPDSSSGASASTWSPESSCTLRSTSSRLTCANFASPPAGLLVPTNSTASSGGHAYAFGGGARGDFQRGRRRATGSSVQGAGSSAGGLARGGCGDGDTGTLSESPVAKATCASSLQTADEVRW
eukprot:scaffold183207_cov30-Tisochrysis_lutea.AAC.1